MRIESSFTVAAPPERVFAHLLDVNSVVRCVPGAELSEVVDPTTFRGRVKIRVGPVGVTYDGTATITERDDSARTATLAAAGRESAGQGSARSTTRMSVDADGEGAAVRFVTELDVVGRVAQFGRGIVEDVSRRIVAQTAECIRATLEAPPAPPALAAPVAPAGPAAGSDGDRPAGGDGTSAAPPRAAAEALGRPREPGQPPPSAMPGAAAELDAGALAMAILRDRALRHRRSLAIATALVAGLLLVRRRRRRRHRGLSRPGQARPAPATA